MLKKKNNHRDNALTTRQTEYLAAMFDAFDEQIEKHPEMLVDPGQEFWDAVEKLVEGVDIGK